MIIMIGLIVLVSAYSGRVVTINQSFRSAAVVRYEMGAEIPFGENILMDLSMKGYSLTVDQAEVLTYEAFLEKYQAEDEYTFVPEKVYDVTITLKNLDAEETIGVNILDFSIQHLAIRASVDPNLYTAANPQMNGAVAIALRKNSEVRMHIPFGLWKEHYSAATWRDLQNKPIEFVATLYPEKSVVRLK